MEEERGLKEPVRGQHRRGEQTPDVRVEFRFSVLWQLLEPIVSEDVTVGDFRDRGTLSCMSPVQSREGKCPWLRAPASQAGESGDIGRAPNARSLSDLRRSTEASCLRKAGGLFRAA